MKFSVLLSSTLENLPSQPPTNHWYTMNMQLTLPIMVGFALADSINVVSFGVFIQLLHRIKGSKDFEASGYQYIASYFCTYVVIGVVLSLLISGLANISTGIFSVIGAFVFLLGLMELNRLLDVNQALKRLTSDPKERIKSYAKIFQDQQAISLVLGLHTATREMVYSGGFYLGLISLLIINQTGPDKYTFIFFYNLIVALPLLIILSLAKNQVEPKEFKLWKPDLRRPMMLGIASLQTVLGIWLMFWWFV